MISIGNDIVDLNAIDKHRTQQKVFYSKILSETEQQLFSRTTLPPHVFVWLLWSAKESVYKFVKRLNPGLVFSPVRIEIILQSEFTEVKNSHHSIYEANHLTTGQVLNSENSGSKTINFEAAHQAQTFYLQSCITADFIATLALESPKTEHIYKGIKHIEQSDHKSQSAAVRACALERLNEVYPDQHNFSIKKSPAGYPVILKGVEETNIKATFAHHGNYVAYAFGL